jgi:hypothetical protein
LATASPTLSSIIHGAASPGLQLNAGNPFLIIIDSILQSISIPQAAVF